MSEMKTRVTLNQQELYLLSSVLINITDALPFISEQNKSIIDKLSTKLRKHVDNMHVIICNQYGGR